MANERDRDDLDRTPPDADEEVRGRQDEEFEDVDEGDEEDLDDEFSDVRPTGEVGSEGGSPGDRVKTRR